MYIYSNYYHEVYSMLNIEVIKCDRKERESQGKTCADDDEINDFLMNNIMSVLTKSGRPTLKIPENDLSRADHKVDYHLMDLIYEVSDNHHATRHHASIDYCVNLNQITTTDSRFTFLDDNESKTTFVEIQKSIEFKYLSGPPSGYHDEA